MAFASPRPSGGLVRGEGARDGPGGQAQRRLPQAVEAPWVRPGAQECRQHRMATAVQVHRTAQEVRTLM